MRFVGQYDVCGKRNRGEIDEVLLWGGPYFGIYESRMAGPGAFYYNSPPLGGTTCNKLLPFMTISYERADERLHNYGHMLESVMTKIYGSWEQAETHVWNRFSLLNEKTPGRAGCGNFHYPPNRIPPNEYDYESLSSAPSMCDDWLNYPNLTGEVKQVNCQNWGCSGIGFYKWWLNHLPRYLGKSNGAWNNWWWYVVDWEAATSCYATAGCNPPVLNNPPSCTLTPNGVVTVVQGTSISYDGSCFDNEANLLRTELWRAPQALVPTWTQFGSCPREFCRGSVLWSTVGTFYVQVAGIANAGKSCAANPWCEWEPVQANQINCTAVNIADCNSSGLDWQKVTVVTNVVESQFSFKFQGMTLPAGTIRQVEVSDQSGAVKQTVGVTAQAGGVWSGTVAGISGDIYVKDGSHLRKKVDASGTAVVRAGDFNGDNVLNAADISAMLAKYTSLAVPASGEVARYDVNGDGKLKLGDLSSVLANYTSLNVTGE